jgi:hypothetical protein
MMVKRNLAIAWALLAAPVILFIPAFAIAGIGPCAFRYPKVIVVADALFAAMEGSALGLFAKSRPTSIGTRVGCVLTFVMIVVTVLFELLLVADYV